MHTVTALPTPLAEVDWYVRPADQAVLGMWQDAEPGVFAMHAGPVQTFSAGVAGRSCLKARTLPACCRLRDGPASPLLCRSIARDRALADDGALRQSSHTLFQGCGFTIDTVP